MNSNFAHGAVYTAFVLAIAACTGAGGLAGIGGSGYVATGTITGFGSVFVNGIEFETDSTEIDIEGVSGTEADLGIGMIVRVSGSVNDDGVTGTATTIRFDDDLQGPVSNMDPVSGPDTDGNRSFTVLGIPVIAGSETTFDVSDDISPVPPSFDINTIANGDTVEISGFFNGSGELAATRVELEDGSSEVEVKGTISDLTAISFNLESASGAIIIVDITSLTMLEDLPNDILENDISVEVKGSYDAGTNTLTASYIEGEEGDEGIGDSGEFSVEGLISDYNSNADFRVNGILVDASGAEFEPTALETMLADGLRIEVEGAVVNNVLIADEVEARSGAVRVRAEVTRIDAATNDFEITPVSGQNAVAVTVTTATESEHAFATGDFVEVRGYSNADGGVTATNIEKKDPGDGVVVQGIIESNVQLTVLGTDFLVDASTEYEGASDSSDFFNSVTSGVTLVKVEDDDPPDGIADEVEIR